MVQRSRSWTQRFLFWWWQKQQNLLLLRRGAAGKFLWRRRPKLACPAMCRTRLRAPPVRLGVDDQWGEQVPSAWSTLASGPSGSHQHGAAADRRVNARAGDCDVTWLEPRDVRIRREAAPSGRDGATTSSGKRKARPAVEAAEAPRRPPPAPLTPAPPAAEPPRCEAGCRSTDAHAFASGHSPAPFAAVACAANPFAAVALTASPFAAAAHTTSPFGEAGHAASPFCAAVQTTSPFPASSAASASPFCAAALCAPPSFSPPVPWRWSTVAETGSFRERGNAEQSSGEEEETIAPFWRENPSRSPHRPLQPLRDPPLPDPENVPQRAQRLGSSLRPPGPLSRRHPPLRRRRRLPMFPRVQCRPAPRACAVGGDLGEQCVAVLATASQRPEDDPPRASRAAAAFEWDAYDFGDGMSPHRTRCQQNRCRPCPRPACASTSHRDELNTRRIESA